VNDLPAPAAAALEVTSLPPHAVEADALVVGVVETPDGPRVVGDLLAVDQLTSLAPALGLTGALDDVRRVPAPEGIAASVLVLTGLGPRVDGSQDHAAFDDEALRRAAGAAVRASAGTGKVALALPARSAEQVTAALEGAALGAYAFRRYASTGARPVGRLVGVVPTGVEAPGTAALTRAAALAQAVHLVRDLVNTAPNELYPESFATVAKDAAKGTGVKVSVLDEKALAAGGYGGLVGVGQGSTRGPRLVRLAYTPARAGRRTATVALVGKGITFDSGGLSLKTAAGMETMKSDMAGAATVLAVVVAAARLRLPVAVTGWLCLAENMPSGAAQRPGDVITIRGGTTVEVLNTDAEGRLVLADGLVAAVEEQPGLVVDVATLTGAQVVALGDRVSAVMGTDDARAEVYDAAGAAGESFWPMPLPADLREGLRSKVADIANVGDRAGGMLRAGVFLREFVGATPWAHLDVAGPAFNGRSAFGYTPEGGTGVAVRTLVRLLEGRAER
jgi:leucyl aminopeptidase